MYVKGDNEGSSGPKVAEKVTAELAERGLGDIFSQALTVGASLAQEQAASLAQQAEPDSAAASSQEPMPSEDAGPATEGKVTMTIAGLAKAQDTGPSDAPFAGSVSMTIAGAAKAQDTPAAALGGAQSAEAAEGQVTMTIAGTIAGLAKGEAMPLGIAGDKVAQETSRAAAPAETTTAQAEESDPEDTSVGGFQVTLDMEFREQNQTTWVGYRVTFTFQFGFSTPQPEAPSATPDAGDPIPVEPDGGIGDGAVPLDPLLPGFQSMMEQIAKEVLEIDPEGSGGVSDGLPQGMDFGPIPVEPDGGIGDGAGPLPGAQNGGGFWVPLGPLTFVTGNDRVYGDDSWRRWSFANDGPKPTGGPDFLAGMPLDIRLRLRA